MPRRTNGFQRPFTNDQMLSWVAEPTAAIVFYLLVVPFTFDETRTAFVTVFTVLLGLHIVCWLWCSLADPGVQAQREARYCSVCNKSVPGLDHHCTWLNTCIGKRQYPAFFALVTIGTIMYWFETIVFILMLTTLFTAETREKAEDILGSQTTYQVLVSLAVCYAAGLACALSILFVFHMFLQFTGLGTYAWMISNRDRKVQKAKKKKEKAKAKEQELASAKATGEETQAPSNVDQNGPSPAPLPFVANV
ncbi:Palmitoyltransferase [Hondaea fermentalgiana]|uniref:Palmitoyltransferase n=1 Tax=Hondaea fermentalgiana TaxID=2315210 RepID=A0A2R5G7J6_9STRA|nr:Palmitoyltransferase [Hondaea fermentalgiana]|eukprot:GBG24011.1 Palmitoyltransferase [Hondaea fermentalgiana]